MLRHPARALRNLVGNHPSRLVDRYLSGLRGVEIGAAAHNNFFLEAVNVDYTPRPSTAAAQLRFAGATVPVDVIARADKLPFPDGGVDFVLASHVIEHIPDPIAALTEWRRVARRYVVLVVPSRDNSFDRDRELTPLSELVARHAEGFSALEDRHWSVWDPGSFRRLCEYLGLPVLVVQDPDDKRGNGFTVVLDAAAPAPS